MRSRPPLIALLAALLLIVPATAQAAPGWIDPIPADPGENNQTITGDVDPVYDTDGTMVVVTERYNSGQAKYLTNAYVHPPGGPFTRQELSPESSIQPDTAVDPRGGVAVAWLSGNDIKIVRRPPGGSFGAPETVPTGLTNVNSLQMEIGPDGRETFAFVQFYTKGTDTGNSRLRVVTRSGPGAPLGENKVVSANVSDTTAGRVGFFDLAVGTTGAAVIAFEYQETYPTSFNAGLVLVRRGAGEQDFGGRQNLVPYTFDVSSARVALDAAGRATVAFCQTAGGARRAWYANAAADTGIFEQPLLLSPDVTNPNTNYVRLAVAPDGSAVVGFGGGGGTAPKWVTRRGPLPSTFDTPTRVNANDQNVEPPEVAMGADGVAYAIVRSGANVFASNIDVYRSPAPGAKFDAKRVATEAAAGDGLEFGIGSDGAGNAAAIYKGKVGNDTQRSLIAVPYDGTPPTVTLTAPALMLPGIPGDFVATARDYWGPVTHGHLLRRRWHRREPRLHDARRPHRHGDGDGRQRPDRHGLRHDDRDERPPGAEGQRWRRRRGATPGSTKDRLAPKLRLGLKSKQNVLGGLKLTLRSDEAATAKLSLKVAVSCSGAARVRSISLVSRTLRLAAGTTKTMTLKASKSGKRRLKAARSCSHQTSKATLTVVVTDAAGNVARLAKSVSVR